MDVGEKREKLVFTQSCAAAPVQGTAYNNATSTSGDLQGTVEAEQKKCACTCLSQFN